MTGDIRYITTDDGIHNKLRQATSIIRMRLLGTSLAEWDGQDCDVLVAEAQDPAGEVAIQEAYARGIPVVVIGGSGAQAEGIVHLSPEASVQSVTRVLDAVLKEATAA